MNIKVVTAEEMARVEKKAIAAGASDETFMREAALSLSYLVEEYVLKHQLKLEILLLIGKGNNGGDALATGVFLLKRGFIVSAITLYPKEKCSPLSQKMYEEFIQAGGTLWMQKKFPSTGVILDGIFGTGFQGKPDRSSEDLINAANQSQLPILAVDIPSALNGNTGEVESTAIKATETFYLEFPKVGFFIQDGWNYVGTLKKASFGLSKEFIAEANPTAYLLDAADLKNILPPIHRTQNKYERGYVLAVAGSAQMSGAANLTCKAALRAGAGIIRLFSVETQETLSDEIIRTPLDPNHLTPFLQECKRASSILIGPGLGREKKVEELLKKIAPHILLPCVIDADGLFFFNEYKQLLKTLHLILTPHHGEYQRLIDAKKTGLDLYTSASQFADENKLTLILKGAPTWIFQPTTIPLIIPRGDPGMATAGSGDVLTGILAALLAQHLSPKDAAILGVFLHSLAGEYAALQKTSYSLIASDIIESLPEAFAVLSAHQ